MLNPDNTNNEPSLVEEDMPIVDLIFGAGTRVGLQGLDESPPAFLRGHCRCVMRFALSNSRSHQSSEVLVAPSSVAPPPNTRRHSEVLFEGSLLGSQCAVSTRRRRKRAGGDDIQRLAERAEVLVQLGELSSGRHVLKELRWLLALDSML